MIEAKNETRSNAKPIRALLDVIGSTRYTKGFLEDKIPKRLYGKGAAAKTRYLVMIAIACNAKPDGTGSHPSIATIAQRAMCSEKTAKRAINWLVEHGLLRKHVKAAPIPGTTSHLNSYDIIFPDLSQEFEEEAGEEDIATGHSDDPSLKEVATGHTKDPSPEGATGQNGHSNRSKSHGQQVKTGGAKGHP